VDERQDPRRRAGALGKEPCGGAPDGEEALLHRVLCEPLVAQDPQRQAVCDASVAVVELRERRVVGPCDERDDGLIGEMREVARRHERGLYSRTFRRTFHKLYSRALAPRFGPNRSAPVRE
jgi:hypothetical protein